MYRLIYLSTAVKLFDEKDLVALLEKSKENNLKRGITGLLITKGKTFLQCLEGEKEEVIKLYSKIQKDPRHKPTLLIDSDIEKRLFPDWSMGYKNLALVSEIKSEKLKELALSDFEHLKDEEIYQIFEYLVK